MLLAPKVPVLEEECLRAYLEGNFVGVDEALHKIETAKELGTNPVLPYVLGLIQRLTDIKRNGTKDSSTKRIAVIGASHCLPCLNHVWNGIEFVPHYIVDARFGLWNRMVSNGTLEDSLAEVKETEAVLTLGGLDAYEGGVFLKAPSLIEEWVNDFMRSAALLRFSKVYVLPLLPSVDSDAKTRKLVNEALRKYGKVYSVTVLNELEDDSKLTPIDSRHFMPDFLDFSCEGIVN